MKVSWHRELKIALINSEKFNDSETFPLSFLTKFDYEKIHSVYCSSVRMVL